VVLAGSRGVAPRAHLLSQGLKAAPRREHYDPGVSEQPLDVRIGLPAALAAPVADRVAAAERESVGKRLREGDPTVWGAAGTPELANRLGWLTIAERMRAELQQIEAFVSGVRADGIEDVVLLGMGGSSLAPEVLRRTFGSAPGHPQLHVLDSTDAESINAVEDAIVPAKTLFLVSSKSGGTIEPLSLFAHFHERIADGQNFAAITDPGSGLEALAGQHGFRHTFHGDPDIGGRYSALSAFGIVPGALIGIDVKQLLSGADQAWDAALLGAEDAAIGEGMPGAVALGVALGALAREGRDKLTFVLAETLPGLGLWLEQLVAESTGKHGTGILPVAEEPPGAPAEYGSDRVFAYLPDLGNPDAALDARVQELEQAGHPVIVLPTHGPSDLGRVFLLAEIAVAAAGWSLEINPFDQPNVQQAKDATKRVLGVWEESHELPKIEDASIDALGALLLGSQPPQYVAIMAYTHETPEFDSAIAELRDAIRETTGATTTFGYGPRFLHSTGQFHKGGPKTGRFLQLLHDGPRDADVPGAPYTFKTLKEAQAIGDLQTLRELGLPAERARHSGDDPAGAVRAIAGAIRAAAAAAAAKGNG
jgi:glucose-6-phosphate isomerase